MFQCVITIGVAVLCGVSSAIGAPAAHHKHPTQNSYKTSCYEFVLSAIGPEADERAASLDKEDAHRYREILDLYARASVNYGYPVLDMEQLVEDLYPELLELDPDPPLYTQYRARWKQLQRHDLIADDEALDIGGAKVAVIGMGGLGSGAYDKMREARGDVVVGIDIDPVTCTNQCEDGRQVLHGDPTDADFWDRIQAAHTLELVLLALPRVSTTLAVIAHLRRSAFEGEIAAIAKFEDEEAALREAGATTVFNIYTEAGAGFAGHVMARRQGEE